MLTLYLPTGISGAVKVPSAAVDTERSSTFVSWLVMRTVALAMSAPLGSCTVPVIAPVAPPWPKAPVVKARTATQITSDFIQEPSMVFLSILSKPKIEWPSENYQRKHRQQPAGLAVA